MRCPYCGHEDSRVLDSRPTDEGAAIRRRRDCPVCLRRFTTYERLEELPLWVVKKDGSREAFDRQKVLKGILTAIEKRPIALSAAEQLVSTVERKIRDSHEGEIPSAEIGERVMEGLRELDAIAYIRFASVYREFTDVQKFREEIERLGEDEERG